MNGIELQYITVKQFLHNRIHMNEAIGLPKKLYNFVAIGIPAMLESAILDVHKDVIEKKSKKFIYIGKSHER